MSELSPGERIARTRKHLGLNQAQLAKLAGVSLSTLLRVEKDRNTHRANFDAVVAALGEAAQSSKAAEQEGVDDDLTRQLAHAVRQLQYLEVVLAATLDDLRKALSEFTKSPPPSLRKRG